jgi:hypothetical protein
VEQVLERVAEQVLDYTGKNGVETRGRLFARGSKSESVVAQVCLCQRVLSAVVREAIGQVGNVQHAEVA